MRFVWAVAAFVLAALLIGAGIAQRTVFEGPTSLTSAIDATGSAPYVLVDGNVLGSHPGAQTVRVEGDGAIFAAYGRTADLVEWLARTDYTRVTADASGVVTEDVAASQTPPEGTAPLSPQGSDLWLEEFGDQGTLVEPLQLPADMSLLIASDGTAPAPASISVTWPLQNSTPWAGPLIVAGGLLLAAGIVLYLLGVRHARRSRGPRRKGLPLPATEPIDLSVESADKGVITAAPTRRQLSQGRRQLSQGRRGFIAAPVLLVSALIMTGCSAEAWPQFGGDSSPSPSASVVVPDDQETPVVTQAQAERIVARISETVTAADAARDATAAATRLAGTALAVRETTYRLQAAISDQPSLPTIPAGPLPVILPEANEQWPRTFFAVASDGDGAASTVMSVTQQDAWSPYRVDYVAALSSDAQLNVAPVYVGAIPIPADSPFLAIAPEELAAAYADVLTNGDGSEFAALFDASDDAFRTQLNASRTQRLDQFNQTGAQTGTMTFSAAAGATPPAALATLATGAIIAVTVDDRDTVTPSNTEAVIKVDGDPPNRVVQTLTGVGQSSTGFVTTYANQLFFFVPSQSSNQQIQLLGYSSSILDAKVVG